MENSVKILIPFFCYCCAPGAIEKSDNAFNEFNSSKEKLLLNLDHVKSLFEDKQQALNDYQSFWVNIRVIFKEIEVYYPNDISSLVITSIKRLLTISGYECGLPLINSGHCNQLLIANDDQWTDFMHLFEHYIFTMDGMYYVKYSGNQITFLIGRRTINEVEQYTDVMTSEIEDYWIQNSCN